MHLLGLPILGLIIPAALTRKYKTNNFGISQGVSVSSYSFISICACLAVYNAITINIIFLLSFFSYLIFGFVMFGWALLILGALTGKYYERYVYKGAI
jgi:hypothetical protein